MFAGLVYFSLRTSDFSFTVGHQAFHWWEKFLSQVTSSIFNLGMHIGKVMI